MTKHNYQHIEELNEAQRRQDEDERRCAEASKEMWKMSLEEIDCALRRATSGRIGREHHSRIQCILDELDDIATTAPTYIL